MRHELIQRITSTSGDWKEVIEAHSLESHDPVEHLLYAVALLQTIKPGAQQSSLQQQAALAFLQAQKEGANAHDVADAQWHSALLSMQKALKLAGIAPAGDLLQKRWAEQQGWQS